MQNGIDSKVRFFGDNIRTAIKVIKSLWGEEGERCQICRKHYSFLWSAPDYLWYNVTGRTDGGGLLCIECFDSMAEEKGISIMWQATVM